MSSIQVKLVYSNLDIFETKSKKNTRKVNNKTSFIRVFLFDITIPISLSLLRFHWSVMFHERIHYTVNLLTVP